MLMAALRPTVMGPVVLNDIGPVIETRGLARIIGYVGRMPVPKTWPDAVNILREMNERAFPSFSDAQWEEIAKDVFDEQQGPTGAWPTTASWRGRSAPSISAARCRTSGRNSSRLARSRPSCCGARIPTC